MKKIQKQENSNLGRGELVKQDQLMYREMDSEELEAVETMDTLGISDENFVDTENLFKEEYMAEVPAFTAHEEMHRMHRMVSFYTCL